MRKYLGGESKDADKASAEVEGHVIQLIEKEMERNTQRDFDSPETRRRIATIIYNSNIDPGDIYNMLNKAYKKARGNGGEQLQEDMFQLYFGKMMETLFEILHENKIKLGEKVVIDTSGEEIVDEGVQGTALAVRSI